MSPYLIIHCMSYLILLLLDLRYFVQIKQPQSKYPLYLTLTSSVHTELKTISIEVDMKLLTMASKDLHI